MLFPKPNFKSVLFELLPNGNAYSAEDDVLASMLEAFSKEFSRYFDWVGNLCDSIPDGELNNHPLDPRWEKILGTKNFPAKLTERGIYRHEQLVTNTTDHFLELARLQGFTPEWKKDAPYTLLFLGVPFRGMDHRDSTPEAKAFVKTLLQLKHAHIWISVKKEK